MSTGFPPFPGAPGGGMPGMPGAPMQPAYGAQQPAGGPVAFVLDMPADPTWEPIESSDTLEKDGYYSARIVGEKAREDDGKLQVIFTLELLDPDVVGKKIARFLPHPTQTKGDTWFLWRGLLRSIGGTTQHGQQALRYTPGNLNGQFVFVKTEAYADKSGNMRTGVGAWSTRAEWEEAVKQNRHRWAIKQPTSPAGSVGALPAGMPGFPGMPGAPGALPGAPTMPTMPTPGIPQPGTAPMQAAPPQPGFPQPMAAPTLPGAPVAAPQPMQPPQAMPGFPPQAPPQQQYVQPMQPTMPAFPQNGAVPQPSPTAAGMQANFPGMPPRA